MEKIKDVEINKYKDCSINELINIIAEKNKTIGSLNGKVYYYKNKVASIENKLLKMKTKHIGDLCQISNIITEYSKRDILTLPDLKPTANYKYIIKQCNQGYVDILKTIDDNLGA